MSEENQGNDGTKKENERQYELIDQLLSMHSSLRDKYERRAFLLNTALIGISLFLSVFAFIEDEVLESLGYCPPMARFFFGFSAVIVLICLLPNSGLIGEQWEQSHAEAVRHLAELKGRYRKTFNESAGNDSKRNSRLTTEYQKTMTILPQIPDRRFNPIESQPPIQAHFEPADQPESESTCMDSTSMDEMGRNTCSVEKGGDE